jgi:FCS type zinc finger protein
MEYIISDVYDGKKRKLYSKLCQVCNKEMFVPKHIEKKYCSIVCRGLGMRNGQEYTCAYCNKLFIGVKSRANNSKSGFHFCSRVCKDSAQRIGGISEIMPPHYGTGNGKHDYQERAKEAYGNVCGICGLLPTWNNKPIILDVHHIDGNRQNNDITNLKVVCPNCHRQEEMNKWGAGDNGSI